MRNFGANGWELVNVAPGVSEGDMISYYVKRPAGRVD